MRFFKKTKRFEVYVEVNSSRILTHFFDYRRQGSEVEIWLGRCYFALHVVKT